MKKLVLLVFFSTFFAIAQNEENVTKESNVTKEPFDDYNQWFIEFGIGANKAARAHTGAEFTSSINNPSGNQDFINTNLNVGFHANLAVRYMFNDKFGLRLKGSYNNITSDVDDSTRDTSSDYIPITIETVFNLGSILDFHTWTDSFNLQFYTGFGAGLHLPDDQIIDDEDIMYSAVVGFTPLFKINDRVSLKLDFMGTATFEQDYNWDGLSVTTTRAIDGLMFNASVGLNIALGKKEKSIDWYNVYENDVTELAMLRKELDEIKEKLVDSDQDGVLDFLDREPNTVNGVEVNTKGIAVDRNQNGVPDEIENFTKNTFVTQTEFEQTKTEFANEVFKELLTQGYINVFFGFDKDIPEVASINDVYSVLLFLNEKPDAKIELIGYTDPYGSKAYNEKLSKRRAKYINDLLVSEGIDQSRIEYSGLGVNPRPNSDLISILDYSRRLDRIVKIKLK